MEIPEFPDSYSITEITIEYLSFICFVWDPKTVVSISLEKLADNSTLVEVSENGKEVNETNLNWLVQNTNAGKFPCTLKSLPRVWYSTPKRSL